MSICAAQVSSKSSWTSYPGIHHFWPKFFLEIVSKLCPYVRFVVACGACFLREHNGSRCVLAGLTVDRQSHAYVSEEWYGLWWA